MKKILLFVFINIFIFSFALSQTKDLSGLKFCIDPGHGGNNPANDRLVIPDQGTEFWESESNLQKAFWLKPMLEALGASVILTRYTNYYPNDDEPSLSARVEMANSYNASWFHSIHSNALGGTNTSTNYTLMLVREKRSNTNPYESNAPGMGIPEQQNSLVMANILGPKIKNMLRTTKTSTSLDWTFYGGSNGGWSLGVLRGLSMPGQLSEGSFHDYYPETRRLMNNYYRKMEAYAIRNSFMEYFGVPADTLCIIAGIQKDITTGILINNSKVRLSPGNKIYNGDIYNNGFYMFDSLKAGQYTIYYETTGYVKDSVTVTLTSGNIYFIDKNLMNSVPPRISSTTPLNNDTTVSVYNPITINFTKPMDTASVRKAFSLTPETGGSFAWTGSNMTMVFTPNKILNSTTDYILKIDVTAMDMGGFKVDGNGDGVAGDPYILKFKTTISDAERPFVSSSTPLKNSEDKNFPLNGVITITFNKLMDTSTLRSNIFLRRFSVDVEVIKQITNLNGRTTVTLVPIKPLEKSSVYVAMVYNQVKDIYQNNMKALYYFYVYTGNRVYKNIQTLESFSNGLTNWKAPTYSGSTIGVIPDSTVISEESNIFLPGVSDTKSMALKYTWNTSSSGFLIREYLFQGIPYTTLIDTSFVLQTYVYGDSSNNKIRFCVDDSSNLALHKVNNWVTIDWYGWKLLEWKLTNPSELGFWFNYGSIIGPKNRFDSYQITYDPEKGKAKGTLYFDEMRIAEIDNTVGIKAYKNIIPDQIELSQNYPNPFNPSTSIQFSIAKREMVKLMVYDIMGREIEQLVSEVLEPGQYTVKFDSKRLSSGVYIYKLSTPSGTLMKTMNLLK